MFEKLEKVDVLEIQAVMNLLVEKFRLDKQLVSFQFNNQNPETFKVCFLNQIRTIEEGKVDDEFIKPVQLLVAYGEECVLVANEYNGMFNTFNALITLKTAELADLKLGLECLSPIDDDEMNHQDRDVPRC